MSSHVTLTLKNLAATEKLANLVSTIIVVPLVITLNGDLGAGKTTFTRFLLRNLGIQNSIKSPTFTLVEPYTTSNGIEIYHFDLYRFTDPSEWFFSGMDEYFNKNSICIIEWAEIALTLIPQVDWKINLSVNDDENSSESRGVEIVAMSTQGEECLKRLIKFLSTKSVDNSVDNFQI